MKPRIFAVPIAECEPPHRVSHPEKVEELVADFKWGRGWDVNLSFLIGYRNFNGVIQLLSGSHRFAAAKEAGFTLIPVFLYTASEVWDAFGDLEKWQRLMNPPRGISL